MKKIIEFFIDKSLVVNLMTLLIIVVGIVSAFTLQKDIFPSVDFDTIIVRTSYPGSTSEDVEKLVTLSVERSLKEVDGLKEVNALSAEGSSIVYVTVEPDADLKEVEDDIKTAVDSIDDFPEEAKEPVIISLNNKNRRGVIKVAVKGADYNRLRDVSKKLRDELELNKKISLVEIEGYREDEIVALMDPEKLRENEVTVTEVHNAIARSNTNLSAGKIEAAEGDVYIRTLNEFTGPEDVANVVIRSNSEGKRVKVGDIAEVVQRPVENSVIGRSNGEEALFLDVRIKGSADILDSAEEIKATVNKFFAEDQYSDVSFNFLDDSSYFVKRRLNVLRDNGVMGIVLVFCCLLLFLNFSTSVVTSMGAPLAFMIAFAGMSMLGLSMNLISMFGLILVLGMLVDDSIIVSEHFYQKLEDGMPPKEAARVAALETIKPVTATIVTTMIAFGALFYMGGIMGKFLWPVPATVIICLAASLFECFIILPSHLADFVKLKKTASTEQSSRWYAFLLKYYGKTIKLCSRAPFVTVLGFGFFFIFTIFIATRMNFELFPGDDVRTVFLQFKGRVGVSQEVTSAEMLKVERMLIKKFPKTELQQIQARIGMLVGEHGNKTGNHYGSIVMYLTDPAERDRTTDEIINIATEEGRKIISPEYSLLVKKVQGGPPRGKPVDINLKGDSIADLKKASKAVEAKLKKVKGITSTEIDFEEGNDQIIFKVDEDEAIRLGVSVRLIALELRRALAGDMITEIKNSDEDIEVKAKFKESWIKDEAPLLGMSVLNNQGRRIELSKVVKIERQPGAFVIRRMEGKRIFSVSASIDKAITNPRKVAQDFRKEVAETIAPFKGMTFEFGGENEDTKESMSGLMKSFMIAMACIFLVLVMMFNSLDQPIAVMSAIPLGMIGVVWSFKFFGMSLGFMAMMGVVGLIGVVINDSIVLVNFINIKRETEPNLYKAVFAACLSRLRPVLLTTVTTVVGLLPVAHPSINVIIPFSDASGGDPFLKPMAMSFAWGLAFATAVTLIFIPSQYIFFEKVKNFFRKKENKIDLGSYKDIDEIEEKVESDLSHTEVKV
jgi:multidrug efflux pump subunit AcrB